MSDRCGADGRTRPAKVTTTTRTSEATKVEHDVDPDTGEIVDGGIAEALRMQAEAKFGPDQLALDGTGT